MTQEVFPQLSSRKFILRNCVIIICSTLGSCILFSPAKDFGAVAIVFITHGLSKENYAINFGIFCGIASVAATIILGFTSWNKILRFPDRAFKAIFKRIICFLGGVITSAPLMVDTFQVNQSSLSLAENLIVTILPGIFMSGVYGHSIEFLYNEFTHKNVHEDDEVNKLQKRLALGIGTFLGSISAIGCYWESLNVLSPLINSSISGYILSAFPVVCRAPLFIVSAYNVSKKIIATVSERKIPSFYHLLFLTGILLFSMFTIGGYSDIAHNGMTQSSLYKSSEIFHNFCYPLVLGVAMFCMLLLNADALVAAFDHAKKYFLEKGYGSFLKFGKETIEYRLSVDEVS